MARKTMTCAGRCARRRTCAPSPYIRQVLASFGVVWSRSRLMRLAAARAGAGARRRQLSLVQPRPHSHPRLHAPGSPLPLRRRRTVHMAAGEAWVFDNWRRHSVDNGSDEERVHLVADTSGTAAFWQFVGEQCRARTQRSLHRLPAGARCTSRDRTDSAAARDAARRSRAIAQRFHRRARRGGERARGRAEPAALCRPAERVPVSTGDRCTCCTAKTRPRRAQYAKVLQRPARSDPAHRPRARHDAPIDRRRRPCSKAACCSTSCDSTKLRTRRRRATSRHAVGLARPRNRCRERPLIIVSAPRSGSTLLFEIAGGFPQVCTVGGEAHWLVEQFPTLRPGRARRRFEPARRRTWSRRRSRGKSAKACGRAWSTRTRRSRDAVDGRKLRWLEKTPKNSLRIPFLNRLFPDALFVFLWRDPRENVSSIMDAWRAGGWVTYPSLEGWDGPWSMILPPGWQQLRGRPLEEIAAFQWDRTNTIIIDDLLVRPRERWAVVAYDELRAGPGGGPARRL